MATPALGTVRGSDLVPGSPGSQRWRALDGLDSGSEFQVITRPSEVAGATFATKSGAQEITYWSVADDGRVLLHAADSLRDRARSVFATPLVISPKELSTEASESHSEMRVLALPGAKETRDSGTATRSVRYVRDEEIVVDGAATTAKVVEMRFVADLSGARAERVAHLWVVPDAGIVGESWVEKVVILAVLPKESAQVAARAGVEIPFTNPLLSK